MRGVLLCLALTVMGCGGYPVTGKTQVEWDQFYRDGPEKDGYHAGLDGVPCEACPHSLNLNSRHAWLNGWIRGFRERAKK